MTTSWSKGNCLLFCRRDFELLTIIVWRFGTIFLSAFQASLSVLLTIFYGVPDPIRPIIRVFLEKVFLRLAFGYSCPRSLSPISALQDTARRDIPIITETPKDATRAELIYTNSLVYNSQKVLCTLLGQALMST